jgi:acyl-coenzyme A thioesterase PaaI-like protein
MNATPSDPASVEGVVPPAEGVDPASVNAFVSAAWPALTSPFVCTEVSGRHAVLELEVLESSIRPGNIISGPAQFGAADLALWVAGLGVIGLDPMALTSEMSIRFVRPAFGRKLHARADLDSVGSRQLVGSVVVWTDDVDRPVAVAQGTYVRPRPRADAASERPVEAD